VKASVFIGTSLDGFIARANGDFDFLPPGGGEPHGYEEFMATVDALVIGRKTFETVLTFDAWPYGEKPVFVLGTGTLAHAPPGAVVERMSGDPAEIASRLDARGIRHVYVDGGITIQRFLEAGAHSAPHHYPRSGAHRYRHPALRRSTARHRSQTRRDAAVRQRPRPE
jgi:dihydrofolate reductase